MHLSVKIFTIFMTKAINQVCLQFAQKNTHRVSKCKAMKWKKSVISHACNCNCIMFHQYIPWLKSEDHSRIMFGHRYCQNIDYCSQKFWANQLWQKALVNRFAGLCAHLHRLVAFFWPFQAKKYLSLMFSLHVGHWLLPRMKVFGFFRDICSDVWCHLSNVWCLMSFVWCRLLRCQPKILNLSALFLSSQAARERKKMWEKRTKIIFQKEVCF